MNLQVPYITPNEERSLDKLAGSSDEVTSNRAKVVLMSANGMSTPVIASTLGISERTARNVISAFNRVGVSAVTRKRSPGRPRLLNDEQRSALVRLAHTSPLDSCYKRRFWTIPLLLEVARSGGIVSDISCDTLSREYRRAGVDLQAMRTLAQTDRATSLDAHRGAPVHNTNASKTGAYTGALLTVEERIEYDRVLGRLRDVFPAGRSIDCMHVEMLAVYRIRLMRALGKGNIDAAERLDRMVRRRLKMLRRAGEDTANVQSDPIEVTPAEWATDLLERLAEAERNGYIPKDAG